MTYRYHPEARAELFAAAEWYERELAGLGWEFHDRIEEAIATVAEQPYAGPCWPGLATSVPVRRMLVRQFPFALAYLPGADLEGSWGDVLFIVAVAHLKRRPGYWLERLY